MRLKPTYNETFLIHFRRGKDLQTIEVVDTNPEEIRSLINQTLKGHFAHPEAKVAATRITVVEVDHIRKKSSLRKFVYTRNGRDFEKDYVLVFNLSPRQVRIEIEKAIRQC